MEEFTQCICQFFHSFAGRLTQALETSSQMTVRSDFGNIPDLDSPGTGPSSFDTSSINVFIIFVLILSALLSVFQGAITPPRANRKPTQMASPNPNDGSDDNDTFTF